jgi:rhodanese-related sulfurtransferase
MRVLKYVLLAVALVSLTVLTGCNSTEGQAASTAAKGNPATQQPASAPVDDIHRISIADARAAFDGGKAVIIDVRGEPSYKAGHIKGSQLIAFNEIVARSGELPRDKTIILYCSCPAEHSSVAAAQMLKSKDVNNAAALVGGYPAWKAAGFPVEEPTTAQ